MKNKERRTLACIISLCLVLMMCSPLVFASDLNGVGEGNTTVETVVQQNTQLQSNTTQSNPVQSTPVQENTNNTSQSSSSTNTSNSEVSSTVGTIPNSHQSTESVNNVANAVGNMFNSAGPKEEHITVANEFIEPIANIMNTAMAVILGATSLLMMFTTVLDLLYIAFPPVRDMLDGGRTGIANMQGGRGMGGSRGMGGMRGGYGGMRGGYGMGGMGGMNSMGMQGGMGMGGPGMGGMGMGGPGMQGGMQQQGPIGGGLSAVGRWVSDEAVAACMETQGGIMQGGMGMPVKSMVFSYMKKRSLFLILFGVCVVLFTSTVFTDLGIRLGTWILNLILGFGA